MNPFFLHAMEATEWIKKKQTLQTRPAYFDDTQIRLTASPSIL